MLTVKISELLFNFLSDGVWRGTAARSNPTEPERRHHAATSLLHSDSACNFVAGRIFRQRSGQRRRTETLSRLEQLQRANHQRQFSDTSQYPDPVRRAEGVRPRKPRLPIHQRRLGLAGQLRWQWTPDSEHDQVPEYYRS